MTPKQLSTERIDELERIYKIDYGKSSAANAVHNLIASHRILHDRLAAKEREIERLTDKVATAREALEAVMLVLPVYVHGPNPNSPYKAGQNPCYVLGSKEALVKAQTALDAGKEPHT